MPGAIGQGIPCKADWCTSCRLYEEDSRRNPDRIDSEYIKTRMIFHNVAVSTRAFAALGATAPSADPGLLAAPLDADRQVVYKVEDGMDRREIYCSTYQMRNPFHQFADCVVTELDVMNFHSLAFAADLCPKGGTVLDMCCGRGLLIPFLRYRDTKAALYVGVDIEPKNAQWRDGIDPRRRGGAEKRDWGFDLRFLASSVADMVEPLTALLDRPPAFDLIAYTASIEHMQPEAQRASLHQAAQVAAPGAKLYLTCPTTPEDQEDGYACQYRAHIYEPKDSELRRWLAEAGWRVDLVTGLVTKTKRIKKVLAGADLERANELMRIMPRELALPVIAKLYPETSTEKAYVCSLAYPTG
jgi:SAM-dependent methyltransferase